jgi:transcriptional regulator with GAF, ATPase, and Fis domain
MNENSLNSDQHKLETIIEFAQMLNGQIEFEEILRLSVQKISSLLSSDTGLIMMLNPNTQRTIKTIFKHEENAGENDFHFVHTNVSGWVLKNQSSFITENIRSDKRFRENIFSDFPIGSCVCTPLKFSDSIIGTLLLVNYDGSSKIFSQENLRFVEQFSAIISPFISNAQKIQQYFSSPIHDDELINKYAKVGLIGKGTRFIELLKSIESSAKCNVRVLLEGKSGTGKELIAQAIHKFSERCSNNFVVIDCGAISPNLIESEIFGYVKGAFTGAMTDRLGLIAEADKGTLFLDEVCNLPIELQSKLFRFVQEQEFRPVGSNKVRKVDVRIITASSASLTKLVEEKKFRQELYYRLNVYPISVPSLNERTEDISILANHFIAKFAKSQNKIAETIDSDFLNYLMGRNWVGNVREFENFMEYVISLIPSTIKIIKKSDLPAELFKNNEKHLPDDTQLKSNINLPDKITELEIQLIREALVLFEWNQSRAASYLGIPEQTIRYKMNKYKISNPIL